jgi:hypothetical protein
MESKRQFIIEIYENEILHSYLKKVVKNSVGYYYMRTVNPKRAKVWKFRKNCENAINRINNYLDPTKSHIKRYTLKVSEVTDNQILRGIKLKKLEKKRK